MRKQLIILALIFVAVHQAAAQPQVNRSDSGDAEAAAAAAKAVEKLFEAMRTKNYESIRTLFTPTGQLVAIDPPREGNGFPRTRTLTGESFAKLIAESKQPMFSERMSQPQISVTGDLAVITGRYTFYVGDKFSHCGTNSFNLIRTAEGWKIVNAASTIELHCDRDLQSISIAQIEADPADVSTIDGILNAFYAVVSGKPGEPRQWSRDKTLYPPNVQFTAMSVRSKKPVAVVMNHSEYVNSSNEFFVKEGFTEREIGRAVRRFGNIAHVFSVYEWETTGQKKHRGRGVNSIELFSDGKRWWIAAVSWDAERADNPIPKDLLKKK